MTEPVDSLDLADGKRLAIVAVDGRLAAVPMVFDTRWRRARAGDGASEALLSLLAATEGDRTVGNFTIRSWTGSTASGERAIGVDQTNESVIVGDTAVVKWATHLQEGPHPAPHRIGVLRDGGFTGMPTPWGLVTWRSRDGTSTLVAGADEYLPGAVDGWTWAVDLITQAARRRRPASATHTIGRLGPLIAELHSRLGNTAGTACADDAAGWRDSALHTLDTVCALDDSPSVAVARARRDEIAAALDAIGSLSGTPVIEGHGDLHVGQVLRSGDRLVVTDFDGNPVLPASQRALPIPAVLDVAGMTQSLAHAAIVARRHTELDAVSLAAVDTEVRATFLSTYQRALATMHSSQLYDPGQLRAFRLQQVLREIVYATQHLPHWMYVPDGALPALLDEGTPP